MKRSYFYLGVIAAILLLAISACLFPGRATQPASDVDSIATTIASTVRAAATQTARAQLSGTQSPGDRTGTAVEKREDGTTRYIDYDGGFEVTFPAGWLTVRPKSQEFRTALANEAPSNLMLHDQMVGDQESYNPKFYRVYSYILRPDIHRNVLFGYSKLGWDRKDTTVLDSDGMGKLVRELEASGSIPGFRADTVQLHEEGTVKTIEIGGHWMMSRGNKDPIPLYSTVIFFKPTPTSTVRLTFTFLEEYHQQIAADMKTIMDSIRLIGQ